MKQQCTAFNINNEVLFRDTFVGNASHLITGGFVTDKSSIYVIYRCSSWNMSWETKLNITTQFCTWIL